MFLPSFVLYITSLNNSQSIIFVYNAYSSSFSTFCFASFKSYFFRFFSSLFIIIPIADLLLPTVFLSLGHFLSFISLSHTLFFFVLKIFSFLFIFLSFFRFFIKSALDGVRGAPNLRDVYLGRYWSINPTSSKYSFSPPPHFFFPLSPLIFRYFVFLYFFHLYFFSTRRRIQFTRVCVYRYKTIWKKSKANCPPQRLNPIHPTIRSQVNEKNEEKQTRNMNIESIKLHSNPTFFFSYCGKMIR